MAEKRSEHMKYPSQYSPGGWVTAAQYIVELVCEKNAQKKGGDGDLPLQFWKLDEWSKYFVFQSMCVNRLLKKYHPKPIIAVVKRKNIWTLRPAWVEKVIAKENELFIANTLAAIAANKEKQVRESKKESIINVPTRRTARLGTSSLDKLLALEEELENGEESDESTGRKGQRH